MVRVEGGKKSVRKMPAHCLTGAVPVLLCRERDVPFTRVALVGRLFSFFKVNFLSEKRNGRQGPARFFVNGPPCVTTGSRGALVSSVFRFLTILPGAPGVGLQGQ